MEDRARLLKRIEALEAENVRLRRDTRRLWSLRERVWEQIEPLLNVGTWIWNVVTREIEWSRNMFEILGYDPEVTPVHEAAEAFDQRIHPEDLDTYLEGQERALRGDTRDPVRFRFERPDGRLVHVLLTYSPLREESGEIVAFAGAIVDVTGRVKVESEFLRSERLEAIGRLAGGVAHDFNNLLTIIAGNAELLLMDDSDPEPARQILDAVEVGASLTRQLLSFTRQAPGAPITIALDDLVANTMPLVNRLLREDIDVRVDLDGRKWQVKVDPGQLQTALVNLAVNARDAMPAGGELAFRTYVDPSPASESGRSVSDAVVLRVTDTGVGMDESTRARMFEPFFSTKDGKQGPKGTGLGLASVHSFMNAAGGEVRVKSAINAGTSIDLVFPRVSDVRAAARPVHEPAPLASGEVIVVEDSEGIRRVLTATFKRAGLEPNVYADAENAIESWPFLKHRVRVLVTDVVMPGRTGYALAQELRRERPDLGVVFITGYDPVGADLEGAVLLQKPFTRAQLMQAVYDASQMESAKMKSP